MKKIRINELARELEVKAHEILDRLPELGVQEKKTHSSSIDEDVAIKLRRLYGFDVPDLDPNAESDTDTATDDMHDEPETAEAEEAPAIMHAAPAKPAVTEDAAPVTAQQTAAPADESRPAPGSVAPIRPPLAGRPIHPPVLPQGTVRPEFPRPEFPRPEQPRPAPPVVHAPPPVPPQAAAPSAQTPPVAVIA